MSSRQVVATTQETPPSLTTQWEIALEVLRQLRQDLKSIGNSRHHSRDRALAREAIRATQMRATRAYRAMREKEISK